jgi:hypothetical protein
MEARAFIGRTARRERVFIALEITEPSARQHETTDHRLVSGVKGVALAGEIYEYRHREMSGAGQIVNTLVNVETFAPGWDAGKVARLRELWEAWHLNDMKAACDHQTVVYETDRFGLDRPSLTLTKPCPETGYQFGTKWLVKELPADVEAELREMFDTDETDA